MKWADSKVEDGTLRKKRFIWPTYRALKKWLRLVIFSADGGLNAEENPMDDVTRQTVFEFGAGFGEKPDPEHLPPQNAWERFGNGVRGFTHVLRSKHSIFGFRAACGKEHERIYFRRFKKLTI